MANFGFGLDGLVKGYFAGQEYGRKRNEQTGYENYLKSDEMAADIDAALKGYTTGDGQGLIKLQAKLSQFGKDVKDVIAPHLEMQKQMKVQQETQRRSGVFNRIQNETTPRAEFEQTRQVPPADLGQFGIGPRPDSMDDENDASNGVPPNTETIYRPGSPGRALTVNDAFSMGGPDMMADPSKMDGLIRLPGQMRADEAQAENRIADTSLKKTQANILSDPAAQVRAQMAVLDELDRGGQPSTEPSATGGRKLSDIGFTMGPRGVTLRSNPPAREATGAQNRIFAEYEKEKRAAGWNPARIREGWRKELAATSTATSAASQRGTLDVKQSPEYLQNQTAITTAQEQGKALPPGVQANINEAQSIIADIDGALKNFNPEAIGPIAGKKTKLQDTFGETPVIGAMLGGPLSDQTKDLMTFVTRVRNTIRKERFGATLTANELLAAEGELVSMEKSPSSAKQALTNLRKTFANSAARIQQQGITPRSGQPNQQPAGAKPITMQQAQEFLRQAGGDKNKARQMATQAGYDLNNVQ